jgi:hypothetical protein
MPRAGFEPAITASERTKSVQALQRLVTATGDDIIRETLITGRDDAICETLPVDRLREPIRQKSW